MAKTTSKKAKALPTTTSRTLAMKKALLEPVLQSILAEQAKAKANNTTNSRGAAYGVISKVYNEYKELLPWLTKDVLKHRLKRRRNKIAKNSSANQGEEGEVHQPESNRAVDDAVQQPSSSVVPLVPTIPTVDAILPSPVSIVPIVPVVPILPIVDVNPSPALALAPAPAQSLMMNNNPPPHSSSSTSSINSSKRSAGDDIPEASSTHTSKKIRLLNEATAINEIASRYEFELENARRLNKRVKKGVFEMIVEDVKAKHDFPSSFMVSKNTIRSRISRKKIFIPGVMSSVSISK